MTRTPDHEELSRASASGTRSAGVESIREQTAVSSSTSEIPQRLKARQLVPLFMAQFTLFMAFVAPASFSVAVRIADLAPNAKDSLLALALGIPALSVIFLNPIIGVLSDRTRSRFGRRRPWLILGAMLGTAGSAAAGLVDAPALLIAGWTVAFVGYNICGAMIMAYYGDRLPPEQRGRVMGISGAITQAAPLAGVVLAGVFTSTPSLMFVIPGALAFIGLTVLAVSMNDHGSSDEVREPLRLGPLFQGFWFNPRRYPNLGFAWLSKAFVFAALALMQVYGVYLLSTRLGLGPADVAVVIATVGAGSVCMAILGAFGSGWLSDKLGTRKPLVVGSAFALAIGLSVTGTMQSELQYALGAWTGALSIGVYGAAEQALTLDVLPRERNQNGRFLATLGLANQIPQAAGPFLAAGILTAFGGDYTWVYVTASVFAVLGALAIVPVSVDGPGGTSDRRRRASQRPGNRRGA